MSLLKLLHFPIVKLNLLVLSLFWGASFSLDAQTTESESSLRAELSNHPQADTSRAKILMKLALVKNIKSKEGFALLSEASSILKPLDAKVLKIDLISAEASLWAKEGNVAEAMKLSKQTIDEYERLKLYRKAANACIPLARAYTINNDKENGIATYERMLLLNEPLNDLRIKSIAYNGLGNAYSGHKELEKAMYYYQKTLEIAIKLKDKETEMFALGNMSGVYRRQGNFVKALECVQKTLKMNESSGSFYDMAYDYVDLAELYMQLMDNNTALSYLLKGLDIVEKHEVQGMRGDYLKRISLIHMKNKDYKKAEQYITASIQEYNLLGNSVRANGDSLTLGAIYAETSRVAEAHQCFSRVLEFSRRRKYMPNVVGGLLSNAELFRNYPEALAAKLGLSQDQANDRMIEYAEEGLKLSTDFGELNNIAEASNILAGLYEMKRNYTKAYEYYKRYITLKDSLGNDNVKKKIARKEIEFEFEKKETMLLHQQQLTNSQLEKQKLLTLQQSQALSLSEQASEINRLAYLKEQAEKQENAQQLSLSEEREKGKERDLSLKSIELSAQQRQNLYLGLLAALLFSGLGALMYFYGKLKKQKDIIAQQHELTEHTMAILSHDIKEPLLGVKLLLKKLNKDDPFVAQASLSLENQINSVNGILNNLLRVKKIALDKKDINATSNVREVVQEVTQELSTAIQSKALQVNNELPDTLHLPVAPEKLRIIVHNLLSNAVKYSFPNQQIRIIPEDKGFCIQDFGVGISPEQRSKLMREVTASQKGTGMERGNGLGLFLVGAILQGEVIKVVFDSPETGGTIVKVLNA